MADIEDRVSLECSEYVRVSIRNWYENCHKPNLKEEPTTVHWAAKQLAEVAQWLKEDMR